MMCSMGRLLALALLITAPAISAQDSTAAPLAEQLPAEQPLAIAVSFPGDRFIGADTPLELELSRPLADADGRLAVVIGSTDVTALFDRVGRKLVYRPRLLRLPRGESELVIYQVKGAAWTELSRHPLKVLAAGGFATASAKPTISVNMKGQLAEGHSAELPDPDRPTYQDFTFASGLQSTHSRDGGWSLRTQSNYVGATRREEALRYGIRQDDAPRVDLADYLVQLERGATNLSLGHVSTGANRHLVSGFSSRGISGAVRGSAVSLSLAAMNGSSSVGWDNLTGLNDGDHRIYSATVGVELMPKRPGGIHLDATLLDGSLLPQTGFTQGGVVDAERSTGGGVQLSASTPGQRLRLAAGLARSRFDNPANRDPQLAGDSALVPVERETRGARYVELNAGLLQGVRIAKLFAATLAAGYRHERVDPLYRSVAAYAQADRQQNAFDLTGSLGAVSVQLAHSRSGDNLAGLATILTTNTRTTTAMASVPLASLLRVTTRVGMWPQLSYGLNRNHQFGEGIPPNSDFSASHVPDQMSTVHDASAAWQAGRWRLQYRYNRSFQDNRQPGRERADLIGTANTISLGLTARANLDLSVDASVERQANRELAQNGRVRRIGTTASWRATPLTTLSAYASTSTSTDEPVTSDADNGELRLELARGFDFWRNGDGNGTRGQLFLRYANQSAITRQLSVIAPDVAPTRSTRDSWTLSSGVSLRLF